MPALIQIYCVQSRAVAPHEVVLHGDLVADLAIQVDLLGDNFALTVDNRHVQLPCHSEGHFSWEWVDWEHGSKFYSEGQSD